MAVYSLDSHKFSTLIVGNSRAVADIARTLTAADFPFSILIEPMLDDLFGFGDPGGASSILVPSYLQAYVHQFVGDVTEVQRPPDIIIEPSSLPAREKSEMLIEVSDEFPDAVILSSSIGCTATELYAQLGLQNNIVGFNGVALAQQITMMEIAPALTASEQSVAIAKRFWSSLGFTTETVEDRVGLVSPRILATLINEAAFAVLEKVASAEDIDTAMKLGVNYPKGLLAWADEIGIEVIVALLDALHREYGQERYRPCVLLKQMMRAGRIGKFSGHGFFEYPPLERVI